MFRGLQQQVQEAQEQGRVCGFRFYSPPYPGLQVRLPVFARFHQIRHEAYAALCAPRGAPRGEGPNSLVSGHRSAVLKPMRLYVRPEARGRTLSSLWASLSSFLWSRDHIFDPCIYVAWLGQDSGVRRRSYTLQVLIPFHIIFLSISLPLRLYSPFFHVGRLLRTSHPPAAERRSRWTLLALESLL